MTPERAATASRPAPPDAVPTRTAEQHAEACGALIAEALRAARSREPERLALRDPSLPGRVLASALVSDIPLPPFDNSQMDGYAVRAADLAGASEAEPVRLPVGVAIAAGDPPRQHPPGTASPVMTGAPIPAGADAVVPIEAALPPAFPPLERGAVTAAEGGPRGPAPVPPVPEPTEPVPPAPEPPTPEPSAQRHFASFAAPVEAGRFVRVAGSDLARGARIAEAGARLTPARIGALASAGISEVPVLPRPRVLLCSTGDELDPGPNGAGKAGESARENVDGSTPGSTGESALPPGRIHDANTPMLAAALRSAGAEVRVLRAPDRAERLRAALRADWEWADLAVTSGGISAGAFEVVRDTLEPLGAEFVRVAMQPGGPQGLGRLTAPAGGAAARRPADPSPGTETVRALTVDLPPLPVLCFPGNPVSAMLSAELFLLPALREYAGRAPLRPREQRLLAHDADSPPDKLQLRRGTLAADGRVVLSGPSSHLLAGLADAELIAEIPIGVAHAAENTPVTVWRIDD